MDLRTSVIDIPPQEVGDDDDEDEDKDDGDADGDGDGDKSVDGDSEYDGDSEILPQQLWLPMCPFVQVPAACWPYPSLPTPSERQCKYKYKKKPT